MAVYNISESLKGGKPLNEGPPLLSLLGIAETEAIVDILPHFYASIHQSGIRAVTWMRIPPSSSSGGPLWDEDPVIIATGGYDGAQGYMDLRDATMNEFNRTRGRSQRSGFNH